MARVFPTVLLPVAPFGLRDTRHRIVCLGSAAMVATAAILPLLVAAPRYVVATFSAFLDRSSWEMVWALLEGYWGYGVVAALLNRTDPDSAAFLIHPGGPPWLPISLAFGAIYLFLITRRIAWHGKQRLAAFAAFSLAFFLLYSKGYSPQGAPANGAQGGPFSPLMPSGFWLT